MDRGLALQDLITGTYEVLETVELPKQARVYLLDQLGLCEYVYRISSVFKQLLRTSFFAGIGFPSEGVRRFS